MLNFEKINKMIDLIEDSQIMEGLTFNEFAMEFYSEVKLVPLSRYLKTNNKVKRMPKIMNMRKAGELLTLLLVFRYLDKGTNFTSE